MSSVFAANLSTLIDTVSPAYGVGILITGGLALAFRLFLLTRTGESLRRLMRNGPFGFKNEFAERACYLSMGVAFVLFVILNLVFYSFSSESLFFILGESFATGMFVYSFLSMFSEEGAGKILFFVASTAFMALLCMGYMFMDEMK